MTSETFREDIETFFAHPFELHERLFGDYHDAPSPLFHRKLVDLMWNGPSQAGAVIFREGAKSTRAEEFAICSVCLGRFNYAVILGANEERAKARLHKVKYQLETNPLIGEFFGNARARADVWQESRIIVGKDLCVEAFGAGQSVRGMKFLESRPDFVLIDDLEELSRYFDNVSTPDKRQELRDWFFGDFLPICHKDGRKFIIGSFLHEDSLLSRLARSEYWQVMVVPIETIGEQGGRVPQWDAKFPLGWVDGKRKEYLEGGALGIFEREYMCRPVSESVRSFRRDMLRFEQRTKGFEPCYAIYDPARTVGQSSCGTGKVVASWSGGRILVWKAERHFWQPDEIIDDIFRIDKEFNPIAIGVEVTGLNEFIEQPLRKRGVETGRPLPFKRLNPPRGPGKDGFILGLQPFFAAGEVVLCGQESDFKDFVDEVLGFPFGLKDIINALAYMLVIRPGVPVYPDFDGDNVCEEEPREGQKIVCIGCDGGTLTASLVETRGGGLIVLRDWVSSGGTEDLGPVLQEAALVAGGKFVTYAAPEHFGDYDRVGLRPSCHSHGYRLMKGGDPVKGREQLRRMLRFERHGRPLLRVDKAAVWTVRGLSGGYCVEPDTREIKNDVYRILMQSLESVCAVIDQPTQLTAGVKWETAKDGSRFISSRVRAR